MIFGDANPCKYREVGAWAAQALQYAKENANIGGNAVELAELVRRYFARICLFGLSYAEKTIALTVPK